MKVVLSGIYYPVAILRYFEAALKRRPDVELFTIGPYTNRSIPWNNGMQLPANYGGVPDYPMPDNLIGDSGVSYDFLQNSIPFDRPDIWIHVDAGLKFNGHPRAEKFVIVGTDPHVLNYDAQRAQADMFYCMQHHYMKDGDFYLPYAYDPVWHSPPDSENFIPFSEREIEAALVGIHYPTRNSLMTELQARGVSVLYDLGPAYDDLKHIYNNSAIGLNWSSLQDLTARVFELTALGNLVICNDVPDLKKFFVPGVDVVTFANLPEAVEKTLYYVNNWREAETIAESGYNRVTRGGHSWDDRIEQIFKGTDFDLYESTGIPNERQEKVEAA